MTKGNVSPVGKTWHRAQAEFIVEAFLRCKGNRTQIAKETDLSIRTIRNWLSRTIPDHYPDLLEVMKISTIPTEPELTKDGRKSPWTPERRMRMLEQGGGQTQAPDRGRTVSHSGAGYTAPTNEERIRHLDFHGRSCGVIHHGLGIGEDDDT